jgi:imidazolonepropionase-like amidohydrolase
MAGHIYLCSWEEDQMMAEMSKASFQRALKAGVKIVFAANASGLHGKQSGPYHGEEAAELALMVEYGITPLHAMRSATSVVYSMCDL